MWSGNIDDFYFKVIPRLTSDLKIPFQTFDLLRQHDSKIHVALREALANTLIHADYYGERGIVIEKKHTFFRFANPGSMRVSLLDAFRGGISDPRNAFLFKMFSLIGIGERAGSGIPTILSAWEEQHWRNPQLSEELQPDRTVLILRTVSLLDESSIDFLKECLAEKHDELDQHEVFALVTVLNESSTTNARLQELLNIGPKEANTLLNQLVMKNMLKVEGKTRWTRYVLNDWLQTQHNGEQTQHNGDQTQHNGEELIDKIIEKMKGKKRIKPFEMKSIIVELCMIRPFTTFELAEVLSRQRETIQNHYLSELIKEKHIEVFRKETSKFKYYRSNSE